MDIKKGQVYHNKNKQELIVVGSIKSNHVSVTVRNRTDDIWHSVSVSPKFFEHSDIEFVDEGYYDLHRFSLKNFFKVVFFCDSGLIWILFAIALSLSFLLAQIKYIAPTLQSTIGDVITFIILAELAILFRQFQKIYINAIDPENSCNSWRYKYSFLKIYKEVWNASDDYLITLVYQFGSFLCIAIVIHFFIAYDLGLQPNLDHLELWIYAIAAFIEMILYHSWGSIHGEQ